jgi:protoporphyrinogen oxidase
MLWDAAAAQVRARGGIVRLGETVVGIERAAEGGWRVHTRDRSGNAHVYAAAHVISSMPMRELATAVQPKLPPAAADAARALRYRDFLVVALVVKERQQFDDNWIYVHDPSVKVGRIQNFRSWSPEMVPDPAVNCYGLEYFCFEGDGLWTSADADLVRQATEELLRLGLAQPGDVLEGTVVRQPKAYPVYDDAYQQHVDTLRTELETNYPNLHLVGRNGMHKYNNQDHAMMTAMLTVRNILAGRQIYDVWQVNQDAEYHEAGSAGEQGDVGTASRGGGGRLVPARA